METKDSFVLSCSDGQEHAGVTIGEEIRCLLAAGWTWDGDKLVHPEDRNMHKIYTRVNSSKSGQESQRFDAEVEQAVREERQREQRMQSGGQFVHKQFRVRTLMFLVLVLAIGLAVVAPHVQRTQRLASACYVLGEVVSPGRMETRGRQLTVRGAIHAAGGLRLSKEDVGIRPVRPASGVPEQVLSIDMNDAATDYTIKPADRLIVARSKRP